MTDAEILGHDVEELPKTNEERILAFVGTRPDGCSSFAIAIDTRIQRGAVESILEKLQNAGKVQSTRNGKGVITWYPAGKYDAPEPEPEAVEEPQDDGARVQCPVKGCDSRVGPSGGSRWGSLRTHLKTVHHLEDAEVDRVVADLRDGKEVHIDEPDPDRLKCQYCGEVQKVGKAMHEKFCHRNPQRSKNVKEHKALTVRGRKNEAPNPKEEAGSGTAPPKPPACRHCGKAIEKYLWQHEQFCPENPNPTRKSKSAKASAPELLIGAKNDQISNERPEPAPTPIDDSVPPGSEIIRRTYEEGEKALESLKNMPMPAPPEVRVTTTDRTLTKEEIISVMVGDTTTVDELLARPRCSTCADDQCGDKGKDLIACDDHEPECDGEACVIGRESVPIAVMDGEPKPWSWPTETFDGRAATLARDNPESEHYRRPEVQEDVRAWLLRTLTQLTDDCEARGLKAKVTVEWPEIRADVVVTEVRA